MIYTSHYESALGGITLAGNEMALIGLWFDGQKHFGATLPEEYKEKDLPIFEQTVHWMDLYFSGEVPGFLPPIEVQTTPFRRAVWEILLTIPYGQTMTYGEIAERIAVKKGISHMSAQAVGGAVGHNPVSLIIPCHRVVGTDGSLTGCWRDREKKTAFNTGTCRTAKAGGKKMGETGLTTLSYVNTVIRERPRQIHKGQCGRVLIVAGSVGMAGACVLSTSAALRSGAGLVKAAVPEEIFPILQIAVPQATCTNVSDREFLRSVSVHDAIGIGPGMGVSEKKYQLIEEILSIFDGPVVIDADGITNLCRFGKKTGILKKKDNIILTPHPGECDRLLDALDLEPVSVMGRVEAAEAVSDRTGAVVLLKGADTVVTSGSGSTYINTTGNPGMATGGSGDVLTGVITAFAASGIAPLDAARAGAFVHGMAGDLAAGIMGQWGMTATDIRDQLPATLRGIVGK